MGAATVDRSTAPHGGREIPFNYTSASDRQSVTLLAGPRMWERLEELRSRRVTGRSARLLMRFLGELLIHRRNPYLFQALLDSRKRRRWFFRELDASLAVIAQHAGGDALVLEVLAECRGLADALRDEITSAPRRRARLRDVLGEIVGADDVRFDPFTLVSHATDATDWRLHLPLAVVTPSTETQVGPLLAALAELDLRAIPRGAGTGLTGGAVPLRRDCVVVNTEKLDRIRGFDKRELLLDDGRSVLAHTLALEAGVITEHAIQHAARRGLVFATDPTSAWACTIGGNIAENAGGKDCVLWGTCIDNVLEFRIAMPSGRSCTVRRINHQHRKILPEDVVRFEVVDEGGEVPRAIELRGTEIRKPGLWKDITNKALGGLPGLQKEGTDGIVTSAVFILYTAYPERRTLCLEFFGPSFDEASEVIQDISAAMPDRGEEALQALEHFDEEYVRAIGYQTKSARAETPRAVLVIDVVGHTDGQVERGVATIRGLLTRHVDTVMSVAASADEAERFWADRKRLGAIARRTNAFKINEDVVLPLAALGEFARFVDAANVEEDRFDQDALTARYAEHLRAPGLADSSPGLDRKLPAAIALCEQARAELAAADAATVRAGDVTRRLRHRLADLVRGHPAVIDRLEAITTEVRARRIVLATHMHAGDGNVHVNIPVLSNDRAMLDRADRVVERVFGRVEELGGVVSGEHGIGITKLRYWDAAQRAALDAYRAAVDPGGLMNPGKLTDLAVLDQVFTPSFNLLELEARILKAGRIEELARKIATCVRCGKCKADCCVFHPARGMFFHPRNKNLAIGSLIEALLYDAQRRRTGSFDMLRYLEEVADHCTICHKCLKPCPVDIDTGEVSVLERELLAAWGQKRSSIATRLTLRYLDTRSPWLERAMHAGLVELGGRAQRAAHRLAEPFQPRGPGRHTYLLDVLRSPVPHAPRDALRDALPPCGPDQVLTIEPDGEARATVLYFPGCGSERLHGAIAKAAIHVLLELDTRVVLTPPLLCCGFPSHANAGTDDYRATLLRNTILMSQIREMFSYLSFDAVVVTCGTCREGLDAIELPRIFAAPIVDVARFAIDRGLALPGPDGGDVLYHAPCHDSLQGQAEQVLGKLGGYRLSTVPHCCSEAGTLALSRPDISDAMLDRKRDALGAALLERASRARILTNCPSCVQGLERHAGLGLAVRHVTIELAERLSGAGWPERFAARAARATAIRI
jgi:FAD/FMN-containing dehydrogenase/Fe-S oxidoreductase